MLKSDIDNDYQYQFIALLTAQSIDKEAFMTLPLESPPASNTMRDHPTTPRFMKIEWLGQTVASLCWVGSMFFSGLNTGGDWLQLTAALAKLDVIIV